MVQVGEIPLARNFPNLHHAKNTKADLRRRLTKTTATKKPASQSTPRELGFSAFKGEPSRLRVITPVYGKTTPPSALGAEWAAVWGRSVRAEGDPAQLE